MVTEITNVLNIFSTTFFIEWIRDDSADDYLGYIIAISIATLLIGSILVRHHFFYQGMILGLNIRKSISGIIFKKVLRFSNKSLSENNAGKIITIVSGELQVLEHGITMTPYVIIGPITTILAFILIAINFREAAAIGFIGYLLLVFLKLLLSKATLKWKYRESLFSDQRVKLISDAIDGIRTLKCYAWEVPFKALIQSERVNQL